MLVPPAMPLSKTSVGVVTPSGVCVPVFRSVPSYWLVVLVTSAVLPRPPDAPLRPVDPLLRRCVARLPALDLVALLRVADLPPPDERAALLAAAPLELRDAADFEEDLLALRDAPPEALPPLLATLLRVVLLADVRPRFDAPFDDLLALLREDLLALREDLLTLREDLLALRDDLAAPLRDDLLALRDDLLAPPRADLLAPRREDLDALPLEEPPRDDLLALREDLLALFRADLLAPPLDDLDAPFLDAPFLDAPFEEDLPPPEDFLPPFFAAAFLVDFAIVNGFW